MMVEKERKEKEQPDERIPLHSSNDFKENLSSTVILHRSPRSCAARRHVPR